MLEHEGRNNTLAKVNIEYGEPIRQKTSEYTRNKSSICRRRHSKSTGVLSNSVDLPKSKVTFYNKSDSKNEPQLHSAMKNYEINGQRNSMPWVKKNEYEHEPSVPLREVLIYNNDYLKRYEMINNEAQTILQSKYRVSSFRTVRVLIRIKNKIDPTVSKLYRLQF